MDAVQRASLSQLRREELKRLQLKNSVLIEEDRRIHEREKVEKEKMRTHMTAAQALQRLHLEEQQRQMRQQRAAAIMHSDQVLRLEMGRSDSANDLMNERLSGGDSKTLQVVRSERMQEEKRLQLMAREQAYEYQLMNTEVLHQQAAALTRATAEHKDMHRHMTYMKAREDEMMRRKKVEDDIIISDRRFEMTQAQKESLARQQKEEFQVRAAEVHRRVKSREAEVMAFKQVQQDKYEAKRERAEWVEAEKERLKQQIHQRRQNFSYDEEMYQRALKEVQNDSWDPHAWAPVSSAPQRLAQPRKSKTLPVPSAYYQAHQHLHNHNHPHTQTQTHNHDHSSAPHSMRPATAPSQLSHHHYQQQQNSSQLQTTSHAARQSIRDTYLAPPARPKSAQPRKVASSIEGSQMSARDLEIQNKLNEEHRREKEREGILRQVQDPRQRARLHKLFSIERHQAQQAIIRLQVDD